MPHPHVWSKPPAQAEVGMPFSYQLGVISSLGDVQHRYEPPENQLWDIEKLTFALRKGPAWLKMNGRTGQMSGTPVSPGTCRIELEVRTQSGGLATQEFDLAVGNR
jgi:hypothetical protein